MTPHDEPFCFEQEVEVGLGSPAGVAAVATQERRAGMGLEAVKPDARAVGLKCQRYVAQRKRQQGMFETP